MLRTLWGIEGPDEEVRKVVVKAFRNNQPGSTLRGSHDPPPPQEPLNEELGSSTSSQSTSERLNTTLAKLNTRETAVKQRYEELSAKTGVRVEDHHDFMFELWKIANERAEAYEIAYAEEKSMRESVEERTEKLLEFLREAGMFHPRGQEENEKNEKKIHEEELRRMLRSETEKRPPKGPPPIAPQSPKASPRAEPPKSSRTDEGTTAAYWLTTS